MRARQRTAELTNFQFSLLLALPVLVFLVLVVAYPLGYALWMSLHEISFFGGYKATFVGAENFSDVIDDRKFKKSLWITVRFTLESVALAMVAGLLIALVLNRKMRFAGLVRTIVILPWCISLYGTGVIFSYLAKGQTGIGTAIAYALGIEEAVNVVNRQWVIEVLAVGNAWNMAPLVAFFLLANLKTIPSRLYDLAAIDRMSRVETFLNVTLPPLRFTLFVFTCITTVLSMKLFDFIFVLSGGGPGTASATLTYRIYKESFKDLDLGYGAAMSFMLLALILGTTLLLYAVGGGGRRGRYENSPLHDLVMARVGDRPDLDPAAALLVPEELPADARRDRALSASALPPGPDARRLLQHLRVRVRNGQWDRPPRLGPGQSDHPRAREQPHRLGGRHAGDAVRGAAAGLRLRAPRLPPQEQALVRDLAGGRAAAGLYPDPVLRHVRAARSFGHADRPHHRYPHDHHSLRDLDVDRVFPQSSGGGAVGPDRWVLALRDLRQDHRAAGAERRRGGGGHRLPVLLERVHLCAVSGERHHRQHVAHRHFRLPLPASGGVPPRGSGAVDHGAAGTGRVLPPATYLPK